jgi:glutamate synthase domain-containing protein 2/Na+-translocating ferredoxin:NAD+ oxidoreductase RNF subunit RnfB
MPGRYHVEVSPAPASHRPVSRLIAVEDDGCLGCRDCVKRDACVYDVYSRREFDAKAVTDSVDAECVTCMRCVQECKKGILSRVQNPAFAAMGDGYWRPEWISSIWKQAETGSIPVSGAGYDGPFAGPGFDQMWTDMSEIVRPTRDGIHGREYISTAIELGRRPRRLAFDDDGRLLTELQPLVDIPIPIVLDTATGSPRGGNVQRAVAAAARSLSTLAVATYAQAVQSPPGERAHLIARYDPQSDDIRQLGGVAIIELADSDGVGQAISSVGQTWPGVVVSVRLPVDERAFERVRFLGGTDAGVIHLQLGRDGRGMGRRQGDFAIDLVKEIHFALVDEGRRDQVAVLVSGGIALAEHVAKVIACGADGVGLDLAVLAALECRLCPDCEQRVVCPAGLEDMDIDWGTQRIVNLVGSYHSQLLEVLGAMGLREVRRLRGELGRALFFDDLERQSFAPLFGKRLLSLEEALDAATVKGNGGVAHAADRVYPPAAQLIGECPPRFRNRLAKYKVARTSECVACGKCAEVCAYGVFEWAGARMGKPKAHLCRGPDVCRAAGAYCADHCPVGALRVGESPAWSSFGDPRWPAELLVSTWRQAETGHPPDQGLEHRVGTSGGGFDRMDFRFAERPAERQMAAERVDLSIPLNRRNDGRRQVVIGFPIYGGGMSFGSISLPTMLARARAYRAFDSFTCTGEGGYPEELEEYDDNVITQVATGLFGVREETIQRVRIVEFKYAQGAKPGLGGHLLGDKVTPAVARMREAVQGSSLFSPFPFHSVYSVEDHKKHLDWAKAVNPKALISVKVSTPSDVDMVAVGSYHAGAHVIHLDGSYGGTGAAPDIAKKNIAMPTEYAVPRVHRFLVDEGIRDKITLIASGGIRTAWDVAKAIALGADGVAIGTADLVALECIRCKACERGRGCPRGIATTDPELSQLLDIDWATQRLINMYHSWCVQLQDILARLGMGSVRELVGRSDLLVHLDYDNALAAQGEVERRGW